ncbi:MAG: RIP metalloprotease RseP [Rhizomicrobium sp.]
MGLNFFLNVLSYIWPFLLLITPVVFFHELGHFAVGRFFGVKVETFSIGFGREVFGFTDRKGTRWKFSWLPLGGYVKFWGDLDAASTPDREKMDTASAEELKSALPAKPVWQRMLIVGAGPVANFVLATVIFTAMIYAFGVVMTPAVISKIVPGSPAAQSGLMAGDKIRAVNGKSVESFEDVQRIVALNTGDALKLTVQRKARMLNFSATPRLTAVKDRFGNSYKESLLGINEVSDPKARRVVYFGPIAAFERGVGEVGFVLESVWDFRLQLVKGKADASQMSGPIGIAKMSHDIASVSLVGLIWLAAFISVSIGLVNLFPIPVLDGGHLLYYGCEAVLGRPLSAKAQDIGFRLGLMVMLGLMVFVTWNDIARLNLF